MQPVSVVGCGIAGIVSLVAICLATGCQSTPPPKRPLDAPVVTAAALASQETKAMASVRDNPHIPAQLKPKLLREIRLRYEQDIGQAKEALRGK